MLCASALDLKNTMHCDLYVREHNETRSAGLDSSRVFLIRMNSCVKRSVNAAAELTNRRTGLFNDNLTRSSTLSVIVAENSIV